MKIREEGKVIKIENTRIMVALSGDDKGKCDKCGCCSMGTDGKRVVPVKIDSSVLIGDKVVIEIETMNFLKASTLLFFIPTAGFFAGILLTVFLINRPPDYLYFIGGIMGTAISFVILKITVGKKSVLPEIVEKTNT